MLCVSARKWQILPIEFWADDSWKLLWWLLRWLTGIGWKTLLFGTAEMKFTFHWLSFKCVGIKNDFWQFDDNILRFFGAFGLSRSKSYRWQHNQSLNENDIADKIGRFVVKSLASRRDHYRNIHPLQSKKHLTILVHLKRSQHRMASKYKAWNDSQNLHQVYARLRIYVTAEKWNFSLFIPFTCENLRKLLSQRFLRM